MTWKPTRTSATVPAFAFFAGKGGVGKTTCAAAWAIGEARAGRRVLVVSVALSGNTGFLLSRVLGLRHIQEMTEQQSGDSGHRRYLDADLNEWVEISLAEIVEDPRFVQVGL